MMDYFTFTVCSSSHHIGYNTFNYHTKCFLPIAFTQSNDFDFHVYVVYETSFKPTKPS